LEVFLACILCFLLVLWFALLLLCRYVCSCS
jgi:hypothetical protein